MRNPKYKNQYERYDWLKEHGICVNCGQEDACIRSIYCEKCGEKFYNRNRKNYLANIEEHKKRNREYSKRLYAQRKEKGLCPKCGKKAVDGKTLCLSCLVKQRKRKDPRWNNSVERSMRNDVGLCYVCGKPLQKYDKLCDDCHDRVSKRMKELNADPTAAMIKAREEYVKKYRQFKDELFKKKEVQ